MTKKPENIGIENIVFTQIPNPVLFFRGKSQREKKVHCKYSGTICRTQRALVTLRDFARLCETLRDLHESWEIFAPQMFIIIRMIFFLDPPTSEVGPINLPPFERTPLSMILCKI